MQKIRPLKPYIYVRAAELVTLGKQDFSCQALNFVLNGTINGKYDSAYVDFFRPETRQNKSAWFTDECCFEDREFKAGTELGSLARSLALLFMAEIAKDPKNFK